MRLKAEREAEEKRLEDDFKQKLLAKFAEDERIEQLAQRARRQRELDHKKEVERLWQERLAVFREERAKEHDEHAQARALEKHEADVIEQEKQRLLAEHATVLEQHHPKAHNGYFSTK